MSKEAPTSKHLNLHPKNLPWVPDGLHPTLESNKQFIEGISRNGHTPPTNAPGEQGEILTLESAAIGARIATKIKLERVPSDRDPLFIRRKPTVDTEGILRKRLRRETQLHRNLHSLFENRIIITDRPGGGLSKARPIKRHDTGTGSHSILGSRGQPKYRFEKKSHLAHVKSLREKDVPLPIPQLREKPREKIVVYDRKTHPVASKSSTRVERQAVAPPTTKIVLPTKVEPTPATASAVQPDSEWVDIEAQEAQVPAVPGIAAAATNQLPLVEAAPAVTAAPLSPTTKEISATDPTAQKINILYYKSSRGAEFPDLPDPSKFPGEFIEEQFDAVRIWLIAAHKLGAETIDIQAEVTDVPNNRTQQKETVLMLTINVSTDKAAVRIIGPDGESVRRLKDQLARKTLGKQNHYKVKISVVSQETVDRKKAAEMIKQV